MAGVSCLYVGADTPGLTATMKDMQSGRTATGHLCVGDATHASTWVVDRECDYSEQCMQNGTTSAQCVSCGAAGARTATATEDGQIVEDSAGCLTRYWGFQGCFAASGSTPAAAYYYWQHDTLALTFSITPDGKVTSPKLPNETITATAHVEQMTIAAGGAVELDMTVDAQLLDNFQMPHTWHMQAHLVNTCATIQ
jgi:hypothetical protein